MSETRDVERLKSGNRLIIISMRKECEMNMEDMLMY